VRGVEAVAESAKDGLLSDAAMCKAFNSMLETLLDAERPEVAIALVDHHVLRPNPSAGTGTTDADSDSDSDASSPSNARPVDVEVVPNAHSYNLAIRAYADFGDCYEALSVLETMRTRDVAPNKDTHEVTMSVIRQRDEEELEVQSSGAVGFGYEK